VSARRSAEQLLLDLPLKESLALEDFLPAASNCDALAWLVRWPDWPAPALVVHGPEGAGKSHLGRIFEARWGALRPDPAALPSPAAIGHGCTLIIDPAEPVPEERALLHLYNAVAEARAHLLLIARRPPAAWDLRLPDLISRLRATPAVAVGPPDDELLAAVLIKLFDDRQISVETALIDFLVRRMERSFAAAARLVEALDACSLRERRAITLPLARRLLDDMRRHHN
jgi:chromosomal replication initiation ATPase DnaA